MTAVLVTIFVLSGIGVVWIIGEAVWDMAVVRRLRQRRTHKTRRDDREHSA